MTRTRARCLTKEMMNMKALDEDATRDYEAGEKLSVAEDLSLRQDN